MTHSGNRSEVIPELDQTRSPWGGTPGPQGAEAMPHVHAFTVRAWTVVCRHHFTSP